MTITSFQRFNSDYSTFGLIIRDANSSIIDAINNNSIAFVCGISTGRDGVYKPTFINNISSNEIILEFPVFTNLTTFRGRLVSIIGDNFTNLTNSIIYTPPVYEIREVGQDYISPATIEFNSFWNIKVAAKRIKSNGLTDYYLIEGVIRDSVYSIKEPGYHIFFFMRNEENVLYRGSTFKTELIRETPECGLSYINTLNIIPSLEGVNVKYDIYRNGRYLHSVTSDSSIAIITGFSQEGIYTVTSTRVDNWYYLTSKPVTYDVRVGEVSIIFYRNSSEHNTVNKTLLEPLNLQGRIKNTTSIINPDLTIEHNGVFDYNYCYIPRFKRYYFVKDIVLLRTNLWQITLSIDTLMSYKDNILELPALVDRNQFEYDLKIEDEKVDFQYGKELVNTEISTGDTFVDLSSTEGTNTLFYVASLVVVNYVDESNDASYPVDGAIQKPSVRNTPYLGYGAHCVMSKSQINELITKVAVDEYLASTVLSVRAYPNNLNLFGLPTKELTLGAKQPEGLGGGDDIVIQATCLIADSKSYYNVAEFSLDYIYGNTPSFLDYKPYRIISIFLPYYGFVDLDNLKYVGKTIKVQLIVDYNTGIGKYVLSTNNTMMDTYDFKLGIDFTISYTNQASASLRAQNLLNEYYFSAFSTIVPLLAGGVKSYVTGDITPVILGGLTSLGTALSAGGSYKAQSESISVTSTSRLADDTFSNLYLTRNIIIREMRAKQLNYGNIISQFGGKLCKYKSRLGDLTGKTVIKEIHLEGLSMATSDEIDILTNIMKGVIIL